MSGPIAAELTKQIWHRCGISTLGEWIKIREIEKCLYAPPISARAIVTNRVEKFKRWRKGQSKTVLFYNYTL